MKFRVAILDDEQVFCDQLRGYIKQWSRDTANIIQITSFHSSEMLLKALDDEDADFDAFFLDIVIEHSSINGIGVAKAIRERNEDVPIVFITSISDYLKEGYRVEAVRYLIKPLDYSDFEECMERVAAKAESRINSEQVFKINGALTRVPNREILYFSASGHYVDIHMKSGDTFRCLKNFKALVNELPGEFAQCHRGLIVNIEAIYSISRWGIQLINKETIPISDSYYQNIQERFMLYFV